MAAEIETETRTRKKQDQDQDLVWSWADVRRALPLAQLPTLLLGAVCVWAVARLFVLRSLESDEPEPVAVGSPEESVRAPVETLAKGQPARRIDGQRLLSVRVLRENLNVEPLAKHVLRGGEATLLNFWGTYCTPCVEELPAFKELTEQLAAPMLHFVPVLVDDQVQVRAAREIYDRLGGPRASGFVADGRLPDPDSRGLTELEAAFGGAVSLPTTVVLDCEHRLRWSKRGKLGAGDLKELRGVLARVIEELGTPVCVAERRRARRQLQPQAPGRRLPPSLEIESLTGGSLETESVDQSDCNPDGKCDLEGGETVKNCPVDCKPKILSSSTKK